MALQLVVALRLLLLREFAAILILWARSRTADEVMETVVTVRKANEYDVKTLGRRWSLERIQQDEASSQPWQIYVESRRKSES